MQYISILEPTDKGVFRNFIEEKNLSDRVSENYRHPQEDYLLVSMSPSVFVVSDGVTFDITKLIERNTKYPDPSPSGEVAKIFCESLIAYVKSNYNTFDEAKIKNAFKIANAKVGEYNMKVGKSDIAGNITGFYAATGAFAVIDSNKAYWAAICDSFVAHFGDKMNLKFRSSGSCFPYAVINGEERMADYLESGVFNLERGDRTLVYTDGFKYYAKNPDFLELFVDWDESLKARISKLSKKLIMEDPDKYGHERSLIAVLA